MQGAIVRKVFADLTPSVLQTYQKKVLGSRTPIVTYGGERPEWYDYPNGTRIWVGGMDHPGKVLSSERDMIFVNQAEELARADWETLSTRVTGRAGNMPYGLLYGDCNPAGREHWILKRTLEGKLTLFKSYHRDNPSLFNPDTGEITRQGTETMGRLGNLTGHLRARLLEGEWASPEGLVYPEFDLQENVTDDEPDKNKPIELAVDDGYVDPRAILFIQRSGTRIMVFDELYHSRHLGEVCTQEVLDRCRNQGWPTPEIAIGSPEAVELRVHFRRANIPYRHETHKVVEGIKVVRKHIRDGQGVRTLQVHRRCVNFIREVTEGYQYPPEGTRQDDEKPIDGSDHCADAFRYWCWVRARR